MWWMALIDAAKNKSGENQRRTQADWEETEEAGQANTAPQAAPAQEPPRTQEAATEQPASGPSGVPSAPAQEQSSETTDADRSARRDRWKNAGSKVMGMMQNARSNQRESPWKVY